METSHGVGTTERMGTRSRLARNGIVDPWTTTEKATTTKMIPYTRDAPLAPSSSDEDPEQDRHRALQAAPRDEDPLAEPHPDRREERGHDERPDHEREQQRDQQAVQPDRGRAEVGEVDREPEDGEDGDLAQARE